jgi:hypothetical protein
MRPCLSPQSPGYFEWLDAHVVPPRHFVAALVQLVMMRPTKRDRVFIAYLPRHCAGLRKAEMVGI